MSSRNRNSAVRPTQGALRNDQLPPYKKPSHPLNADAKRALENLPTKQHLRDLQHHHKQAEQLINDAVEIMYDNLRERKEIIERRRKKWDQGLRLDDKEKDEQYLQKLDDGVEDMTKKLEVAMRGLIDGGSSVERISEVMKWVTEHGVQQIQRDYATQISQRQSQSQSQRRQRRREQNSEGEEEEQDEEEEEARSSPGPTPFGAERVELTGPTELFLDRLERQKNEYLSHTHTARYAKNNAYIGFKGMVHEVKYGDTGPPLPPPETWFTERGSPAPGVTEAGAEDDDDIIIDKETISTRCPLTFRSYKEPVTSRKCPHTFERSAILEIIRTSNSRVGGGGARGGGERAVQCPVSGCDQMLTGNDLHTNPVLVRKIKRMQAIEAQQNDDSEEEVDVEIDDNDDEEEAPPQRRQHRKVKDEDGDETMMSEVPSTQQPPRSSHVIDMGDPSDDEDEE